MKLMRLNRPNGGTLPLVSWQAGIWHDASSIASDFSPSAFAAGLMAKLSAAAPKDLPEVDVEGKTIAPPISQPSNIWCVGLNYSDHAEESGLPIPEEPILFNKASSTFCGPNDNLLFAPDMTKLDWEVELALVIGQTTFRVSEQDALDHVAGYALANDVSERAWQLDRGGQWVKGKSFVNFCPVGPWLVTPDELGDIQKLDMWLYVNGTRKQNGSTAKMIFDVKTIVSYMSQFIRLEPGDLILTGTPPGVGLGQNPPEYLAPGDVVELGISGLGTQRQKVVPL